MSAIYVVHIAAGTIGLIAGFIALFVVKGATVHRKAGAAFVYTMLAMCLSGGAIALLRSKAAAINVPAALITAYLALTALTTVRGRHRRGLEGSLMLLALGVGVVMLAWGIDAVANGGMRNGYPAFPFFLFATFGLFGAAGDVRVLRRGPLLGTARLIRHLWRVSMALLIAALSFAVQLIALLKRAAITLPPATIAIPLLVILLAVAYWVWRLRFRRSLRGLVLVNAAGAPTPFS
jgi:hypothetical protein